MQFPVDTRVTIDGAPGFIGVVTGGSVQFPRWSWVLANGVTELVPDSELHWAGPAHV